MVVVNENLYIWDKGFLSIIGKVVSFFFNSKGKKLSVFNLDEDDLIDVFILRDFFVSFLEKFIYNCFVYWGRCIYKLLVDKNGIVVNVEVCLVGLSW